MKIKRILSLALATVFATMSLSVVSFAADENLARGKSYTVEYESPIDNAFPKRVYQEEGALTDGAFASSTSAYDSAFLKLYRGTNAIVTIDLENVCSVSSATLSVLNGGGGINAPRIIYVDVSEDGESFYRVGKREDYETCTNRVMQNVDLTVALDKSYRARYVRLTFSSDVHVYIDEIIVKGTKDASGAATPTELCVPAEEAGYPDEIDGIGNIVLLYTYGNYSENQLYPYITYGSYQKDGSFEMLDTNFECALFLPSGASEFDYTTDAGWNDYFDQLYGRSGANLTSMDRAVATMKETFSMNADYKYPVFISVPFIEYGTYSLGGIKANSLENRTLIVQKMVDRILKDFADCNFANLELKGLYWHNELIPYTASSHEEQFVINFNNYVHQKGLKTIWIPYYCAPGFERAKVLGFDAATLQSGYAFPRDEKTEADLGPVLPGVVEDSAMMARKFGLGMEFEMKLGAKDFLDRIRKYLHTGSTTGCMDGHMMMFYQQTYDLYNAAKAAKGSQERRAYELVYEYNKDKLTYLPPVIEPDQIFAFKTGFRARGKVSVIDPDTPDSELKAIDIEIPDELKMSLDGDGSIVLNTSGATAGLYQVSFRVSDGYHTSEKETFWIYLYDEGSIGDELTLSEDLTVYTKMNNVGEGVTLQAGTEVKVKDLGNDIVAISKKTDESYDFYYLSLSETAFGSSAEREKIKKVLFGEENSSGSNIALVIILIVVGVVLVIAAAVVVAVIFIRKKKN